MVPWKVAWARDSSYKIHRRSKTKQDEKIRAKQEEMDKKVASLESQMDARVNEAVQQALSQRTIGAPQVQDVVISPADQRRSSCASTAVPDVQAEQLQIEAPALEQ